MNRHKVRRVRAVRGDATRSRESRLHTLARKYLRLLKEQNRANAK